MVLSACPAFDSIIPVCISSTAQRCSLVDSRTHLVRGVSAGHRAAAVPAGIALSSLQLSSWGNREREKEHADWMRV